MKKIIVIIYVFIATICFSENIRIASFNTLRLGDLKKDYISISKIISKFDIIALEEVMNEKGLLNIIKNLKGDYSYLMSDAVGEGKYKEHYAIVYKKDKVDKINLIGKYEEKNNEFVREPSAFYIKSNKLDFILIPIHSIYGKKEARRAFEASKYVDVYRYFEKITKQDDIIILGDFNLPASDRSFDNLKEVGFFNILDPSIDYTTISNKGLANSYDNIFIILKNTNAFNYRYGVYNYSDNNYRYIKKYISDHLPIFVEFNNEEE